MSAAASVDKATRKAPRFSLCHLSGPEEGRHIPIEIERLVIGRAQDADLRFDLLQDREVSQHHCAIVRDAVGDLRIVDLGSTNGTFVNGDEVPVEASDGDPSVAASPANEPSAGTPPAVTSSAASSGVGRVLVAGDVIELGSGGPSLRIDPDRNPIIAFLGRIFGRG